MKLADIKTFAKKRKKTKQKDGTPSRSVYGGVGFYHDHDHKDGSAPESGLGGGDGDGGGGGE